MRHRETWSSELQRLILPRGSSRARTSATSSRVYCRLPAPPWPAGSLRAAVSRGERQSKRQRPPRSRPRKQVLPALRAALPPCPDVTQACRRVRSLGPCKRNSMYFGAVRTSDHLQPGELYTRAELRRLFEIADQTINTGIFGPQGSDSIWLFVTERKESDMTPYVDRLEGDILHWQGQTAGLKDALIIEHQEQGLELLLFYRKSKTEHPDHAFRYEGPFSYVRHHGANPAAFVLAREGVATPQVEATREAPPDGSAGAAGGDSEASSAAEGCLVEVIAGLRQSGADSVVAEGRLTELQQKMHVADKIEEWVAARVGGWRDTPERVPLLVVLSGNAGDGKSDLVERLRHHPDVSGLDVDVVADATHADSPSESQAERLLEALQLFESETPDPMPAPRCVLIAINVGMVIAFFSALRERGEHGRFERLQAVLEAGLGLSRSMGTPPAHWDCEVVNLDHRNLLGRIDDGLLAGMLGKLDPEVPGSITHAAAAACTDCSARGSCWVRTNLNLLRLDAVRQALHDLLWEVTLGADIHLSPRNVWDLLYQAITGGLELPGGGQLTCEWIQENLPPSSSELDRTQVAVVHRRLAYQLLFEAPGRETPARGPLLEALGNTDPIRRSGKHTHVAEGEVRAAAHADARRLSELALACDEPGREGRRADALLEGFAELVANPEVWDEDNARDLAFGLSRRARLTGMPAEIQAEVKGTSSEGFLALLHAYSSWRTGEPAPPEVEEFWKEGLIEAVGAIFGVQVEGQFFFRLDTLSPTTRYPAYVPVDLAESLRVKPDPVADTGALWLDALSYLPRGLTATVAAGGEEPWPVPVDLQLYRLLSEVRRGYSASSVDLEAFFRLRYACERLGGAGAANEIVFRSVSGGESFRLREEKKLTGSAIGFTRVSS